MQELPAGGFAERTCRNVQDSEGTVIIYKGELSGGTAETERYCAELQRPHILIDASTTDPNKAAALIHEFVREQKIEVLNVAGPRESDWPRGYEYALRVLETFISQQPRGNSAA